MNNKTVKKSHTILVFLKNFINKYLHVFVLLIIVLIWIKPLIFDLNFPMKSIDADGYSRLKLAVLNIDSSVWLPGFTKIMYNAANIYGKNYMIFPRIIIIISTIFISLFVYLIVYRETFSKYISFLSVLAFLYHPLVIDMSSITFTEQIWTLFLIISIYFFLYSKKKYIIFAYIFWILGTATRYESWMLIPIIIPYVFLTGKINIISFIKKTLLLSIFPIYWIVNNYIKHGSPFNFIHEKQIIADSGGTIPEFGNLLLTITSWNHIIQQYIFSNFLFVLLFLIISIFFIKNIKNTIFIITPLYVIFTLILQVFLGNMEYLAIRYLYIIIPTIIIFLFINISNIFIRYKESKLINCFLVSIFFLILIISYPRNIYPFYSNEFSGAKDVLILYEYFDKFNKNETAYLLSEDDQSVNEYISYITNYDVYVDNIRCKNNIDKEIYDSFINSEYLIMSRTRDNDLCDQYIKDRELVAKSNNLEIYKKIYQLPF